MRFKRRQPDFIVFMLQCLKQTIDELETPKGTLKETPKESLIRLINDNPKATMNDIASLWGINKRNAQKRINQYVEEGVIQHIGPSRGGHWEIVKQH